MKARDYELLVGQLVSVLKESAPPLAHAVVSGGSHNRIQGASGFRHQIDVSVTTPEAMILIECKYWRRAVDAQAVLVFASRVRDIQAAVPSIKVHGTIVSKKRATSGAHSLGTYFGVSLDTATSVSQYGLRLAHHVFVTAEDSICFSDSASAEVVRGPVT